MVGIIRLNKNIFLKKKKRKNQNKIKEKLWHATSLIPDRALQKTFIAVLISTISPRPQLRRPLEQDLGILDQQ
jgi:lysine/ornithine N-monooxygenase